MISLKTPLCALIMFVNNKSVVVRVCRYSLHSLILYKYFGMVQNHRS